MAGIGGGTRYGTTGKTVEVPYGKVKVGKLFRHPENGQLAKKSELLGEKSLSFYVEGEFDGRYFFLEPDQIVSEVVSKGQ